MPATQDLTKLRELIEEKYPDARLQLIVKNTFAVGCHLHQQGQTAAGWKLCNSVLESIGYERRKGYFMDIRDTLSGNERAYARAVEANSEVNELFEHKGG